MSLTNLAPPLSGIDRLFGFYVWLLAPTHTILTSVMKLKKNQL